MRPHNIDSSARRWAALCHISLLAGLLLPLFFVNFIILFLIWVTKKINLLF